MSAVSVPTTRPLTVAPPALRVRQAGSGPPLVMLHGLASSSRYWEPHQEMLGRTYRMIMPDLLGFGRSPKPRGTLYTAAEHVAALLAALDKRVDRPFTLVGHSMGSTVALHLYAARPEMVERLVLISLPVLGSCIWGHEPCGLQARIHRFTVHTRPGRAIFNAGMTALRPAWDTLGPRIRSHVPRGAAQDALRAGWGTYWDSLEAVVYGSDVPALFAAVQAPLTVIHGARDTIVPVGPVRDLAATRPDVRYIEIPDAAHNPAYSHPSVFYDVLNSTAPGSR